MDLSSQYLGMLRQEGGKFQPRLGYKVSTWSGDRGEEYKGKEEGKGGESEKVSSVSLCSLCPQ